MPTLVNPEPHNVRTMEAWAPFRERVHAWPIEKLRARGAELVEEHFLDHAGHREQLPQYLAEAEGEGDLADALILAALRLGEITAFASHPPSLHAYALRRFPWRTFFRAPDALHAIETGAAPRQLAGFVHQSIERELANRPLFIRKLEAAALLRLRPPSEARLRKAAMALIDEHLHAPLKKRAFIDLLLKRCPGSSEHRASLAWAAFAPAAWRMSHGLRNRGTDDAEMLPRMADAAAWIVACEGALWEPGTFLKAVAQSDQSSQEHLIDHNPVVPAIMRFLQENEQWSGTATRLPTSLGHIAPHNRGSRDWPQTPSQLGAWLHGRLKPLLRDLGIEVTHDRLGHTRERIIILGRATNMDGPPTNTDVSDEAR